MRIGAVIPTRGDRPEFIDKCKTMQAYQTMKIDVVEFIDFIPVSDKKDITKRYRIGLEKIKNSCDVVFLWEDDDYYSPDYIELMVKGWLGCGEPSLFGYSVTVYYHLKSKRYSVIKHPGRASAMNTMIKTTDIDKIKWPPDDGPFLDIRLWKCLNGVTQPCEPEHLPCIGIKHGIGVSGGIGHKENWGGYTVNDADMSMLSRATQDMFLFYKELSDKLTNEK